MITEASNRSQKLAMEKFKLLEELSGILSPPLVRCRVLCDFTSEAIIPSHSNRLRGLVRPFLIYEEACEIDQSADCEESRKYLESHDSQRWFGYCDDLCSVKLGKIGGSVDTG